MIIGHAYSIALWLGLSSQSASWATTIVAFGNMLGGFSAGYFSDRLPSKSLLRWLPLATCVGLTLLAWPLDTLWPVLFFALAVVGYCYGAIIAVYPVAVSQWFGALAAPRIYGQVFTAWGLAGLLGPWVSGWFFDLTGSYAVSLLLAILLSMISVVAVRSCPSTGTDPSFN
jgi:OFA family oxalate/formate antiporter-like MFS transporter